MLSKEEKGWLVPMPTVAKTIGNKKIDYALLGALMIESKRNPNGFEVGSRYIYSEKISGKNLKNFCQKYSLSVSTTRRNIALLKNNDIRLLESFKVNKAFGMNEVVYRLYFSDDENKYFVRIPSNLLKELIISYKSNVIKLFCHMLYLLRDNTNDSYVSRFIPLSYLGTILGCNDDTAGRHMKMLVKAGYIQVRKVWEYDTSSDKGNTVSRNYYSISPDIIERIMVLRNVKDTSNIEVV